MAPEAAKRGELDTCRRQPISPEEADDLISQCDTMLESIQGDILDAAALAQEAGFTVESDLTAIRTGTAATVLTAGHSNTDHVVVWTQDYATDRIAELKRNMATRVRAQQPEAKGQDRWDKPKLPGERRRRIVREKDAPEAPPEPPSSGYIIFLGQMTTKMRHDRPNEQHSQTRVVQEISKMWRIGLSDEERQYYADFCEQARVEYKQQDLEFRATGTFKPSEEFVREAGVGLWVRKTWKKKNVLEKEIAQYDTVKFPMRPPEFDEAYKKREIESKRRRKLKQKGLLNEDGTEKPL
ncbi:predicted protein [Phaeodactylum tricornutum CCAP 1055/1]|jgi:hypothetical protein|uniref:HMG box domain-containing protein n=1 Tax=Phaeodactylum tricornutum (strain CCAP 1055/1) TaxID=556484 RepID=B7G361_PHATC|nr:predicted protein [Phaeodactylum tricornutum CCAP 1055/1]EEC46945.1 predicted protein [Phaeodactylum tricornutum CCAP 1055/1]|eukprot:XP_002181731.1 predicted protein [Phaeodactylum tricornutum CCAP 1055/1]